MALPEIAGPLLYVAALDEVNVPHAARTAMSARAHARAEFAYRAMKPAAAFRDAERRGAHWVALLGTDEVAQGTLSLKNIRTGEQRSLAAADLATFLQEHA